MRAPRRVYLVAAADGAAESPRAVMDITHQGAPIRADATLALKDQIERAAEWTEGAVDVHGVLLNRSDI
jgi:hypothetical protein